jgi:hypothetical protein
VDPGIVITMEDSELAWDPSTVVALTAAVVDKLTK